MGEMNGFIFKSILLTALGAWDCDPSKFDWKMSTIQINHQGLYIVRSMTYLVRFSSIESMQTNEIDTGSLMRLKLRKTRRALFILGPTSTISQLHNLLGTMITERPSIDETDLRILALVGSGVRDELTLRSAIGEDVGSRLSRLRSTGLLDPALNPTPIAARILSGK